MGRSYLFECSKCGYKAKVSGRAEQGVHFSVQTILCRDCRELYDAVTGMKVSEEAQLNGVGLFSNSRIGRLFVGPDQPPDFEAVSARLAFIGGKNPQWLRFKIRCPVAPTHRTQIWNNPGKCPRCGVFLEKNALPFRMWE